jgi:glycine/D-amino acid oxidase-like deaminating enzyme
MSSLSNERTRVGVVGGGAWGTALAVHCARMGHEVLLWALEPEASVTSTLPAAAVALPITRLRLAARPCLRSLMQYCQPAEEHRNSPAKGATL